MIKRIIQGAIIVIVVLAAYAFMVSAVNKEEIVECNQWATQANEYPQFYLVGWQAQQCQAHGIIINAPVRN